MQEGKKEIITRLIIIYVVLLLLWAVAIVFQIVKIQFLEGAFWRQKADARTIMLRDVNAQRGNIYSSDNKLLATTVPIYDVYLDLGKEQISVKGSSETKKVYIIPDSIFKPNLNILCDSLAKLFPQKRAEDYKKRLLVGRKKDTRFILVQKNVSLEQLERMKSFPILRKEVRPRKRKNPENDSISQRKPIKSKPQFCRAVICDEHEKRVNPYKSLARRTIGIKVTEKGCDTCYNGLDGAYDFYLKGKKGKRMERRMAQNLWIPIENEEFKQSEDGNDVVSTIDLRIQELAENSLRRCLDSNDADKGCAVLMEVETGYIRAISNLSRTESGQYIESENIAVSNRYEPGSTFKAVTAMILLENKICDTSFKVPTGLHMYNKTEIKDVNKKDYGWVSFKRAFEVSSNVGMCYPVFENYRKKRKEYFNEVVRTFPFSSLKLDLNVHEPKPTIVEDTAPDINFLNLCYGYGMDMTALQLLTFYNAIANDGKMVKPLFVSDIKQSGKTIKHFNPVVLKERICSDGTLKQLRGLLESVVKNGSARRLSNTPYGIAGKTGTAQSGYEIKNEKITYRASFVGYFPADEPRYSCIVLVVNPKKNRTHGGELSAPVFREIADRVCGTKLDINIPITPKENRKPPIMEKGYQPEMATVFSLLDISYQTNYRDSKWIVASINSNDSIEYNAIRTQNNIVPSVKGMTIKDALYLLEGMGLKVYYTGYGKITAQSIPAGNSFRKGDAVYLTLNPGYTPVIYREPQAKDNASQTNDNKSPKPATQPQKR